MIRIRSLPPALLLAGGLLTAALPAWAQQAGKPAGLWLTTDFPAITERIGKDATLSLTLANSNLPPARVAFALQGLPAGWNWTLSGDGKPVGAAIVSPDQSQTLSLKIVPPKDVKPGTYSFTVTGQPESGAMVSLPISLTLGAAPPERITLEPKLPQLRGTPSSKFDYQVTLTNHSSAPATVNLVADAPPGFVTSFSEQYGSQELTSLPFKPGESKTVQVSVHPPQDIAAGHYAVMVGAEDARVHGATKLVLDVTGQPHVALTGPGDRLSGSAVAGREKTFTFHLENTGSAPATNIRLTSTAPSGWKVVATPKTIDSLAPGRKAEVAFSMTPSDKAIAGDYMVDLRAAGQGAADSAQYRVTVLTSTTWGLAGLGVIGAAAIVLAAAVTRYGRR